jgi:tetratricopeptide (TPR) repeat protein
MPESNSLFSVDWRQRVVSSRGKPLDLEPQYFDLYAFLAGRRAQLPEQDDGFASCEEIQMLGSWSRNSAASVGKQIARHVSEWEAEGKEVLIEAAKRTTGPYRIALKPQEIRLDLPPGELLAQLGLTDHSTSLALHPEDVGFRFSELYWRGVCLFDQGYLTKSYRCFRRALKKAPTPQLRAAASFYARRILERWGKHDRADAFRAQHAGDLRKCGRYEGWARTRDLNLAAWLEYRRNGPDQAETIYRKALASAQRLGQLREMGEAYNGLGEIARVRNEREKALRYYLEALDAWMLADYFWGFQAIYVNIGAMYRSWGDLLAEKGHQVRAKQKYQLAVEWTNRCTDLCREFGLGDDMAEDHAQLSSLYRKLGRADLALHHGRKAQEMALRSGNRNSVIAAMRALLAVHLERDESDQAAGVLAKAAVVLRSAMPEALLSILKKHL